MISLSPDAKSEFSVLASSKASNNMQSILPKRFSISPPGSTLLLQRRNKKEEMDKNNNPEHENK